MSTTAALQLSHVCKLYGSFKAVTDLDFSVSQGTICGFLGPNGAGKTTTIRMILEIIRPTSGQIMVLGQPSALHVRNRLGYLPEEKGLYKKMKAWATIAYFASLKGLSRSQAKRRARELLERYGLEESIDKPIEALSKGMAQKVQMLSTIAHDPELVILDEPFSGLDPVNQQVMEEIIYDLAQRGRTILFSTHVMQHAERLCTRIILLARGRKIFDGTIPEAKRALSRRVRIETEDSIDSIRSLKGVVKVSRVIEDPSSTSLEAPSGPVGTASIEGQQLVAWEFEIREQADAQAILQACFRQGIHLRSFQFAEPSLHDVFVHLVKPSES